MIIGGSLIVAATLFSSFRLDKVKNRKSDWSNTVPQPNSYTCGYACIRMVLSDYGIVADSAAVVALLKLDPKYGTSMANIRECAESFGLTARGWSLGYEDLSSIKLPAIAHMGNVHFVVVDEICDSVKMRDPLRGRSTISKHDFLDRWTGNVLEFSWACPAD